MIILEFIGEVIITLIFEGIILNLLKLIRKLGVLVLQLITFSKSSFKELDQNYYKDAIEPYFIGFGIIIGLGYLLW